jgi:hypothetical protein
MDPGEVTRILVRFAPQDAAATVAGQNTFPFDPTTGPGYLWHCHILEHEENDMMRGLVMQPWLSGAIARGAFGFGRGPLCHLCRQLRPSRDAAAKLTDRLDHRGYES